MVTHSSIPAWKIPWTEEPAGLQSMRSQSDTTERTLYYFLGSNLRPTFKKQTILFHPNSKKEEKEKKEKKGQYALSVTNSGTVISHAHTCLSHVVCTYVCPYTEIHIVRHTIMQTYALLRIQHMSFSTPPPHTHTKVSQGKQIISGCRTKRRSVMKIACNKCSVLPSKQCLVGKRCSSGLIGILMKSVLPCSTLRPPQLI